MLVCPHCNQEIELKALEEVRFWNKPIGGPAASLGCGSLIIIAIIVYVFSGGANLSDDVSILSRQVDELTVLVREIQRSLADSP